MTRDWDSRPRESSRRCAPGLRDPDQARHAPGLACAPVGIETHRIIVGAVLAAVDARNAERGQTLARQHIEIAMPFAARGVRTKRRCRLSAAGPHAVAHLVADPRSR